MIDVYLRHADADEGYLLISVPWAELERMVEHVCRWGVTHEGNDYSRDSIVGNYRLDEGSAYFEIVVGVE